MPLDDPEAIAAFYAKALREHGGGPRAVGWNDYHAHAVNFVQLLRTDGLTSGVSVLDVGCGHGALERFLRARGLEVDYTGYDICEPLVAEARRLSPDARFEVRDIDRDPPAERFDFVFASGVFAVHMCDHEAWSNRMVEAMYGLAGRACAFNMLSASYLDRHPGRVDPTYAHFDPAIVLARCLQLTPQVTLDHSEQALSFTVYMYRRNAAPVDRLTRALTPGARIDDDHRAIAEHYAALGLVDEAFAYLDALPPSAELYEHIAILAWDFCAPERRVPAWERAAELAPTSARILGRLAIAYLDDERPTDALAAFERARAADPADEAIAAHLASLRAVLGE